MLRQVRAQQKVQDEAIGERGLYLRVIVPVNVLTIADDIRILQNPATRAPAIEKEASSSPRD